MNADNAILIINYEWFEDAVLPDAFDELIVNGVAVDGFIQRVRLEILCRPDLFLLSENESPAARMVVRLAPRFRCGQTHAIQIQCKNQSYHSGKSGT